MSSLAEETDSDLSTPDRTASTSSLLTVESDSGEEPSTAEVPDAPTFPASTVEVPDEPTLPASTAPFPPSPTTTPVPDDPGVPTTTLAELPSSQPTSDSTYVAIAWDQACSEQYVESGSYARADEDVYTAWVCYITSDGVERELGDISVESYCAQRGWTHVVLPDEGRDSWRCDTGAN